MKKYEKPIIDLKLLDISNVILASNEIDNLGGWKWDEEEL